MFNSVNNLTKIQKHKFIKFNQLNLSDLTFSFDFAPHLPNHPNNK